MRILRIVPYIFFSLVVQYNTTNETQSQSLPEKLVIDEYHGQKVEDPYRYMENLNDSTVINWYKQQKSFARLITNKISNKEDVLTKPFVKHKKDSIRVSKLEVIDNDFYFYLRKNINTNSGKLLYYRKGLNGKEKLLYNPIFFKSTSTSDYVINYFKPSWDGTKVVISLTKEGIGISEMIVLDIITKQVYPQVIDNCWPSELGGISWLPDNSGFIYVYIPTTDRKSEDYILNTASVLYKLGENPRNRHIIFSKTNNPQIMIKPEDFPMISINSVQAEYMFGRLSGVNSYHDIYYAPVASMGSNIINWKPLFKQQDLVKQFEVVGDDIIFLSAKNAEHFRICKTSLLNPDLLHPEVLVPEDPLAVITDIALTKNNLFYVKIKNGIAAKLYQYGDGMNYLIPIPKPSGNIELTSKGANYDDLWIDIEGWAFSKEHYRYDHEYKIITEEYIYLPPKYQIKDVVIKEVEVTSHDNNKVPLSIIYKKGIKLDKSARLLLYGYGAFGNSKTPRLGNYLYHWVNNGGIYAVAHVRGGGEKGDIWHKGGYKTTKPNTWKDFIACTEYLIDKKYTTPEKIVVAGSSAGGILIGRAITERPDLFAAAIIKVGVLNTLRLEFGPNGKNSIKEFGTVKDSVEFKALLEMDAYHHIKKGEKYPALYITAGMNDAKVPAWQPGKFVAKMQAYNASKKPVLFSVDFRGGHGNDISRNKRKEELINILSFALWQTGHPDYQVK